MKRNWRKGFVTLALLGTVLGAVGCNKEQKPEKEEIVVPGLVTGQAEWKELKESRLSRVSVHDPSIFRDVDETGKVTYYVYGTHITSAKSDNLADWKTFTNGYKKTNNTLYGNLSENLAESFAWAGENDADCKGGFAVWAPDIVYNENYVNDDGSKGAYLLYYSVSSTYCRSAIGYAVADTVEGPFTYKGTIVYSGFTQVSAKDSKSKIDKIWTNTNIDELMAAGRIEGEYNTTWGVANYNTSYAPNAIDPTVFTDTEGRMWMCYGSWSGGIYLLEIDPASGDAIYPGKDGTTEDGRVIDKYFGTRLAGGFGISGEGPYILYDEATKYYYLYTTYNYLDSVSGYNMRLFRSEKPEGPYLDAAGNNAAFENRFTNQFQIGIKVMGNYKFSNNSQGYRSPGHNSAFIDEDGQRYLLYHTRFENNGERFELRVHQQFINEDGWPVTAVFENRNDLISATGYEKSDIAGVYEFINHGISSDGAGVKYPDIIVLHEDGTISGDHTGTWEEKEGTYLATFVIGDVTYKGVFFKQHDEKLKSGLVMTFTAIGNNNETIWGVKSAEGTEYKERVVEEDGAPATDFSAVDKEPVVKLTFEDATGIELTGDAKVADGVLSLAKTSSSYNKTYAKIPDITGYDFSEGITFTADILVSKYETDWTPLFMLGDGTIGGGCKTYGYHFTQGFSSVTDDAKDVKVGYYGADIKEPYIWSYFSQNSAQNVWHTITVTITEKQMCTYINGEQVQTGKDNYKVIMETFKVATNNYLGGSYYKDPDFCGKMDNFAIYNTCLSAKEVKALARK